MSTRLLILGSTGLIGSACERYAKQYRIANLLCPTRAELDLLDRSAVQAYFKQHQPQQVILAAGIVGGIAYNHSRPVDFIHANLMIQLHVFEAALQYAVEKVVFFGSSCMYPKRCVQPMHESLLWTGELEPTSTSYALSKLAGVELCRAYNQQYHRTQYIALIPNSTFGPQDNFDIQTGHVLSALIAKMHLAKVKQVPRLTLWGSGNAKREFVYVDDVASAVFHVLQYADVIVGPLNIGVGRDCSIKALAEMIAEIVGYRGVLDWDQTKPDGALQKLLDNTQLLQLGWRPTMALEEGIRRTYDWYLASEHIKANNTLMV